VALQEWKSEADVKAYLIHVVERGYVVFAVLGSLASASRFLYTGWQSLYTIHLSIALAVLAMHRCPVSVIGTPWRIWFAVFVPAVVGLSGLYTFGFYGNGLAWTIVACAMAAVFLPLPTLVAFNLFQWLSIVTIGFLFTQRILTLPVDGGNYIHLTIGWMPIFIGSLVLMSIVTSVVFGYKRAIGNLLATTLAQRDIIHHQASHDTLTGLPNKSLVDDRLAMACERAIRDNTKAALLFIDLDGFKTVNDTQGHHAGDRVLIEVAHRLETGLRKVDTAARLGGDEFLVVLDGINTAASAEGVAAKLLDNISRPIDIGGAHVNIGVSIGIAMFPDDTRNVSDMVRLADGAMYAVKRSGKNGFQTVQRQT
jgi:diguanylate cyclase (GGDEF)-like protein